MGSSRNLLPPLGLGFTAGHKYVKFISESDT
jgi:hypothetical protein